MSKTTFIYALCEPDTGRIRYVGKTIGIKKRLQDHLSTARKGSLLHVHCWIRKLLKNNVEPTMKVIDECGDNWVDREKYWIEYYRAKGCRLTNLTDGGEGATGYRHTPEAIKRMSEFRKNDPAAKEHWAGVNNKKKGTHLSESQKKILSEANKGKIVSAETRKKLSAGRKGKRHSAEARRRISECKKGKKASIETRKAMSETRKRQWAKLKAESIYLYGGSRISNPIWQMCSKGIRIKRWESVGDAAKGLEISRGGISHCLGGKTKTAGGFAWKRAIPVDDLISVGYW